MGIAVYSGEPTSRQINAITEFLDIVSASCRKKPILLLGGYRGGMKTVVDMALERGFNVILIIPREYEADPAPEGVAIVRTGMDTKARSALLVRSSDVLVSLGGASGTLAEVIMAYGLGIPVVYLVGVDLPTDELRRAYPDGILDPRIGNPIRYASTGAEAAKEACRLLKLL